RDFHVTGVQTCALPISLDLPAVRASIAEARPLIAAFRNRRERLAIAGVDEGSACVGAACKRHVESGAVTGRKRREPRHPALAPRLEQKAADGLEQGLAARRRRRIDEDGDGL